MKCKYCGSNLGIEDEYCPYCGKLNDQAAGHQAVMKEYRDEYEKTKSDVKVKSRLAGRTGRLVVIGAMLVVIAAMGVSIGVNSDVENREQKKQNRVAKEVESKADSISATLKELEDNRDYLGMSYYSLNYRLRSEEKYSDYSRVFTAAIDYNAIYDDIINILAGFEGYENETDKDRCYNIAIYISDWNSYVGGEFWNDSPSSPMHAGGHGEFLKDAKKDTQDMVQVYFDLTDEEAASMWTMDRMSLGEMLYDRCRVLYPKEGADE